MDFILPTTLTNAMLIGSNIAENEYDEWDDGGFNALNATGGNRNWTGLCCSSSNRLWACIYGAGIWYSDDSGVTWTDYSAGNKNWNGIGANGTDIYALVKGGSIWKLTNQTGSFTDMGETSRNWDEFAVSATGKMYVTDGTQYIYAYDSGSGHFDSAHIINGSHTGICGAPNGDMYCARDGANIWRAPSVTETTYADLGDTIAPHQAWRALAAKSDGTIIALVNDGDIYERLQGAGNFTGINGTSRAWRCCCVDANDNVFAGAYGGDIYKSTGSKNYMTDDYCQVTTASSLSTHKIYQSLIDNNRGNDPVTDNGTKWVLIGNTNRTKAFDGTIGNQSSQATLIQYIVAPGAVDAVGMMNIESTTLQIIEFDPTTDKVTNGTAFTDATGATPPTGWHATGSPTFLIDDGAIKITASGDGDGMHLHITVTEGASYLLKFSYKNTSGDVAKFRVDTDGTSSTFELDSSLTYTDKIYRFTANGGTHVDIYFLAKTSGDIVWFDSISLSDVVYNSGTVTTGATKTEYTNTSLVQKSDCLIAITINYAAGTAKVGELIVGVKTSCGTTEKAISGGTKSYSTKAVDSFGHYTVTSRGYSKKLTCTTHLAKTSFDALDILINTYRDYPLVWIASTTYNATQLYGYYIDHQWSILDEIVVINWEIEGLA